MREWHWLVLSAIGAKYLVECQFMRLDIREATIDSVHNSLYSGLTSCREVVSSFLSRVEAFDTRINAIISLNPAALALAERIDAALAVGNATGPLFCIPVLLKDNYDTSNMNTTGGNLGLAGSQPSVDAPSVVALERAGAVILGKVNLHELALEGLSVSSLGGQTINPYDFSRTPGGSSGGSGAAVAASFSVLATGSDTVNSLRSPASANSLFSIRPTRGLISRAGIIPISYTQDVIGPIARTVKDVATALTVMASIGFDSADNATALVPETSRGMDYTIFLTAGNLKGIRLGVINGFFNRTDSNETAPVNEAMDTMIHKLQSAGVIIIPINEGIYNVTAIRSLDVQRFEYRESMDTYLTQPSLNGVHPHNLLELYAMDSSSGSGKFLVIPSQYEFVNTVLISSTSNATYASIQSNIHSLTVALHSTLSQNNLDAIIYPEQQNLVVKLGSPSQSDRNGILAALTGSPVVTVPAGFSAASEEAPVGVPIGMEILGRPWQEESLLRIAYQIEMLTHVRRMPAWAKETVEAKSYVGVPVVKPNNRNIPTEYPVGVL